MGDTFMPYSDDRVAVNTEWFMVLVAECCSELVGGGR